jgi:hypothetical protein
VLFAVTSFGRTQFASAYGLILRASQIRQSKSIGFGAKVHAASVQKRLDQVVHLWTLNIDREHDVVQSMSLYSDGMYS